MNAQKHGLDEIRAQLTERLNHADANPLVRRAPNGDQNPITIWHSEMDPILAQEPFRSSPDWEPLRAMRDHPAVQGSVCTEYPGIWVRQIVKHITLPE